LLRSFFRYSLSIISALSYATTSTTSCNTWHCPLISNILLGPMVLIPVLGYNAKRFSARMQATIQYVSGSSCNWPLHTHFIGSFLSLGRCWDN
jgi:hypothetical protein